MVEQERIEGQAVEKLALELASRALGLGIPAVAHRIDVEVVTFLRESEYTIALLGEFSVGKSTLINALIGLDTLPVRIQPTTTIVTEVIFGPGGYRLKRSDKVIALEVEEFQQRASGLIPCQPGDVLEVEAHSPLLRDKTRLVDTPGVHSLDDSHEDVTYGYLSRVDVALVVMDANQGDVPRSVVSFLENHLLRSDMGKLVFVVNKVDEVPSGLRERLREKFRVTLAQRVEAPKVLLACVEEELEEGEEADEDAGPGLREVLASLNDEILPGRKALQAQKAARRLKTCAAQLVVSLETERSALQATPEEIDQRIAELKRARDRVNNEMNSLEAYIQERMEVLRHDARGAVQRMLQDVSQRAELEIRSAGVNQSQALDIQGKIRGWIAQGMDRVANQHIHSALLDLGNEIRGKVHNIQTIIPDFQASAGVKLKGEAVLDVIIEGAILLTLNVILPGEWMVAAMARMFGSKLIQSVKEPVVTAIKQLVGTAVGQAMLDKVIKKVDSTVMGLEGELSRQLVAQLQLVEGRMIIELRERFDAMLDEHQRALNQARSDRNRDDAERGVRTRQLEVAVAELEQLMDAGLLSRV